MSISYPDVDKHNEDQTTFDLTPFPMWIYDLTTYRFLKVNREAVRHYGYSEMEFLTMTIKDIRPKEDLPKLVKAIEATRTRKDTFKESLFRHQKKDGSLLYVKLRGNLIEYHGRKAEIVTAIDLTETYEREKKIETQKRYFQTLGEINQLLLSANHWIKSLYSCFKIVGEVIEVDRIYYFENNLQKETTSQRLEWTYGKTELQIDQEDFQNISYSSFPLFIEALRKGGSFKAVVEELPPSPIKNFLKSRNVMSVLALPIWVSGEFRGFIGFDHCRQNREFNEDACQFLDTLTSNLGNYLKRQDAYQELSFSEAKFKSLIENGKDLIAIIDKNAKYKYISPNTKTVLGVSPEEFIGKNPLDFIYESDKPRLEQCFEKVMKSKFVSIAPYRFPDGQGNWRWIRTELTNHLDTPLINGIVANTSDVTTEVKKRLANELVATLSMQISQPGSLASGLNKALKNLVKFSKISVSEIWLISPDTTQLNLFSKVWQREEFSKFYELSNDINSVQKGEGLSGSIWKEEKTVWFTDISNNKNFLRSKAAHSANLHTGIGLPILFNNEFLGCILCLSEYKGKQLYEKLGMLAEVSEQIGPIIKQKITEEEYRSFFDLSSDPHCIIGFDGSIKKYNRAVFEVLGYKENEVVNQSIFKFIHPDDREKSEQRLKDAFSNITRPNPYTARFLNNKGQIKWLVWTGTAIPESKVYIAIAKDVTEQKIAEQKLKKAYEQLKSAQKIAKLGYWYRNYKANVSVWSEETYSIYEYSPNDFVPTLENITKTLHPEDRHLVQRDSTKLLEAGKVKSFEHRIISGSGKEKWVKDEIRLITDDEGNPIRVEGTVQDITERKKHEEELTLSNERFRLAIKASNEMIWEVDHKNQQGIDQKKFLPIVNSHNGDTFTNDNSWFSKIHKEDRERVWEYINKALQDKKKNSWELEYRIELADGSISYIIDRCYILRDKEGHPIRSVGSALDVTASRQQLERIKKQNEKLREISWLQSHVIRSPLSKIMSLIYLLKDLDGDEVTHEEVMEMILKSAHELDGVIHEITDKINMFKNDDILNAVEVK
ncbi:MAG: PAS domain S-box protein [Arenibacter sp.]|nr:PAS domain S-box protein [Arenibacter sp.]